MTRRVAFVTGGGRGIGAATAYRLAAAGMAVVVADRDSSAARSVASAVDGLAVQVDVSRPDEVEAAVTRAVAWGGGLHYAYNNAGVPGVVAELAEYPDKVWTTSRRPTRSAEWRLPRRWQRSCGGSWTVAQAS